MARWLLIVCINFLLNGCKNDRDVVAELEEPLYQKGQQCLRENRADEAFKLFNRLIAQRKDFSPNTHFELGQLYLSVQKDPIFAIYHFRQYLIQEPEGKRVHLVLQMIETAKKEFARTLPMNDRYSESPEYLNLIEVLKQVRSENNRLKTELMRSRTSQKKAVAITGETVAPVESSNVFTEERTYIVQNEDSLSKISLKMYGSAVKWNLIFEANRDVLPSANSLKIGMKLRIPPLKK